MRVRGDSVHHHQFEFTVAHAEHQGGRLGRLGVPLEVGHGLLDREHDDAADLLGDGGRIALHASSDVDATLAALRRLPGIGDWTAQYIAMRALRWPDAFPAGDVALHKALAVQGAPQPARAALAAAQAWRPWRSYGVIRAWAGLAAPLPNL